MNKILALLRGLVSKEPHPSYNIPDDVSLAFSDELKVFLKDLMVKTNNPDIVQLIRVSLASYDASVHHVSDGGKIIYRKQDGTETIFNPLTNRFETGS